MEEKDKVSDSKTSKRRRWLAVGVIAVVAVIVAAAVLWPGEKEPEYQGKKLSYWMGITLPPGEVITAEQCDEAIRHIGTNAIPWLLHRMRYEIPQWRMKIVVAYSEMPAPVHAGAVFDKIYGPDPAWVTARLPDCFIRLGNIAAPVVPELISILEDRKSSVLTKQLAMVWLRQIGEASEPSLPCLRILETSGNTNISSEARYTIEVLMATNALKKIDGKIRAQGGDHL